MGSGGTTALCLGLLLLLAEVPSAKTEAGYCLQLPRPLGAPGRGGGCSECSADADCAPGKKCCGSECGNTCQTPERSLCRLPPDTGPCKARLPQVFYSWQTKTCEWFTYGGCFGNRNRFATKELCELACGAQRKVLTGTSAGRQTVLPLNQGRCPKPGIGPCVEMCASDASCPKGSICCFNGCGHTCMRPVLDVQ